MWAAPGWAAQRLVDRRMAGSTCTQRPNREGVTLRAYSSGAEKSRGLASIIYIAPRRRARWEHKLSVGVLNSVLTRISLLLKDLSGERLEEVRMWKWFNLLSVSVSETYKTC